MYTKERGAKRSLLRHAVPNGTMRPSCVKRPNYAFMIGEPISTDWYDSTCLHESWLFTVTSV